MDAEAARGKYDITWLRGIGVTLAMGAFGWAAATLIDLTKQSAVPAVEREMRTALDASNNKRIDDSISDLRARVSDVEHTLHQQRDCR